MFWCNFCQMWHTANSCYSPSNPINQRSSGGSYNYLCLKCGYPGMGAHYAGCPELGSYWSYQPEKHWSEEELRKIIREELIKILEEHNIKLTKLK